MIDATETSVPSGPTGTEPANDVKPRTCSICGGQMVEIGSTGVRICPVCDTTRKKASE